jgi:1,4-dihydroxy-2-naphthoate octaprenyltransferase
VFLSLDGWILTAGARLDEAAGVFLASLPLICGIADIMLANNLCDMGRRRGGTADPTLA